MQRSEHRILTTHVGSLVRTKEIVELHIRRTLGEPWQPAEFDEALRDGVHDVRRQVEAGIDVVDDGEFGKLNWIAYVGERLDGFVTTSQVKTLRGNLPSLPYKNVQHLRSLVLEHCQHAHFDAAPGHDIGGAVRQIKGYVGYPAVQWTGLRIEAGERQRSVAYRLHGRRLREWVIDSTPSVAYLCH